MGDGDREEGDHDERVRNDILHREERGRRHDSDTGDDERHDGEHAPEPLEESGKLLKDGRVLDVLLSSGPGLKWEMGREVSVSSSRRSKKCRRTML